MAPIWRCGAGLPGVLHEIPSGDVSCAVGLTAGKVYDVFLYDNAGTLALSLSAAWADDVTGTDAGLPGWRPSAGQRPHAAAGGHHLRDGDGQDGRAGYNPAEAGPQRAHPVQRAARVYVAAETRYCGMEVWNNDANVVVRLIAISLPIRADVGRHPELDY